MRAGQKIVELIYNLFQIEIGSSLNLNFALFSLFKALYMINGPLFVFLYSYRNDSSILRSL